MKKNIIALAIASVIAAPVAMADAPTVYGQLNLNINDTDGKDTSVNSTASRLGVKGSEDLGNGLKAVYKVEFGLDSIADSKNNDVLSQRNAYVGLAGGFGTVLMGRHDTPLKMSQPSDLFNDGAADLGKMTEIGANGGENRADDVLAYVSPSFGGIKIVAAAVMGEAEDNVEKDDGYSVAAMYGSTKEGLYLALAMDGGDWLDNAGEELVRLSAQYKASGLTVNGMYQENDIGENFQAQAAYKIGKFMPKVKYSMDDYDNGGDESAWSIGLNYSLGKKTTAYIYTVDKEDIKGTDSNSNYIAGILHKF
ncbi:porin [Thiomicrorhabdus indica]|uniref:porin n=1 Tax=Thiomicrorhabdus indica TaxID=2267253 RepID=UPI00102DD187|nr:porin [Thiomicrorhabdus indica]